MRLVRTDESTTPIGPISRPRSDYLECRTYKELDRLLYRVLQLSEILRASCACDPSRACHTEEDCTCNSEKALDLKRKIWRAQKKLDQLYVSVKSRDGRRALTKVEVPK